MLFNNHLVILRSGGDLATGVAYRLHQAGFPVIVLELEQPLVVRRRVALATAVLEGEVTVQGLRAVRVETAAQALALAGPDLVPVLPSRWLPEALAGPWAGGRQTILVDARMAKANIDTDIRQGGLVIGLGPGFTAGTDCHAVVETMRGHNLGRVIWHGPALPNTGTPGIIAGKGAERVLRAPVSGEAHWHYEIGEQVTAGAVLGDVAGREVRAPFDGVVRGLITPGTIVTEGIKIGDIDARGDAEACVTISDKALAIGGGVLAAALSRLPGRRRSQRSTLGLAAALGLGGGPEIVAIVGGGGKSSLLFALGRGLTGRTLLTTTTRIFAAQMSQAPAVHYEADVQAGSGPLVSALKQHGQALVVGEIDGEKALGVEPSLPADWLARGLARRVIVEADGSRMRPCKAPAGHEPVLPQGTTLLVPMAGIDALERPIQEAAHRPELVSELTGLSPDEALSEAALAALLSHSQGGLKGAPPEARIVPFINKVETGAQLAAARRVAAHLLAERRVQQVVIGALRTPRPVREVRRRVTAVVLAAGRSERMGPENKLLLPWGQETVLGATLKQVKASSAFDILLVIGHQAADLQGVADTHGVATVHNPHHAGGEMLSSLQAAVHILADDIAAVLVVLGDQPLVPARVMDQILDAYAQGLGGLVAPAYRGQRGNPVLIERRYFPELLALPDGAAPRRLLQRYAADLHLVEVDDDGVLKDLDEPADYRRWRPE